MAPLSGVSRLGHVQLPLAGVIEAASLHHLLVVVPPRGRKEINEGETAGTLTATLEPAAAGKHPNHHKGVKRAMRDHHRERERDKETSAHLNHFLPCGDRRTESLPLPIPKYWP